MDIQYKFNESQAFKLFRPVAFDRKRDMFVCDDNTTAMSFLCSPISGWDTDMIEAMGLMLNDAYPENAMISISLFSSPDVKNNLAACDYLRRNNTDPLSTKAHNTMLGFFWDGIDNPIEDAQNTRLRNYQLIITLKMPVKSMDVNDREIERFDKAKRTLTSRLERANFFPQSMTVEMYVNIMNVILHWDNTAEWRKVPEIEIDETREINKQLLQYDTPVVKTTDGVIIGEPTNKATHVKMLTIRRFPKKTRVGRSYLWYGDPFDGHGHLTTPFLITLNICFPEIQKTKEEGENKHKIYTKLSQNNIVSFVPKIKEMKEDLDAYIDELLKTRGIKVTLSAAVFGRSEEEAESALTDIQAYFKIQGTTMVRETKFSVPSFINMLPMGADSNAVAFSQRYFTMATRQILPMMPVFSDWKGTGTPIMLFVSRMGQLMSIDLFDSETNFNTVIYAESGAGKSVLGNEIIRSYLTVGATIWGIDAGESYKKLSTAFQGNFIAFNEQSDFSLNPFTMINESDPNAFNESVETLARLITAMAFHKDDVRDFQYKNIEKILYRLWQQKKSKMTIDDVAEACLQHEDQRMRDVGSQLYSFTTEGQFGKYFDKPHNVSFKGRFNVLELDGLSKTPELQSVVLYLLVVQIQQEMYEEYKKDRDKQRIVLIDEAWQLLGNSPTVTEFMEFTARRARKYNGALVLITQSIRDLQKSEAGRSIAENAANSLILKQKSSTISAAEKDDLMSLPEVGYRLLRKVTTLKGKYSEIFFNTGKGMGIGRLIVDGGRLLMFSTNSKDNSAIDKYTKAGLTEPEAISRVLDDRGLSAMYAKPEFLTLGRDQSKSNYDLDAYFDPKREGEEVEDLDEIFKEAIKNDPLISLPDLDPKKASNH